MNVENEQLSSREAVQAFKKEINKSFDFIEFLEHEGKEEVWQFWKTASSALKLALNGKGTGATLPSDNLSTQNIDQKGLEKDVWLNNLSNDAITVCIPLKEKGGRQYRILKLMHEEVTDDYIEVIPSKENTEGETLLQSGNHTPNRIEGNALHKIMDHISHLHPTGTAKMKDESNCSIKVSGANNVSDSRTITSMAVSCCSSTVDSHLSSSERDAVESIMPSYPSLKQERASVNVNSTRQPSARLSAQLKEKVSVFNLVPVKMREFGKKVNKINILKSIDSDLSSSTGSISNSKLHISNTNEVLKPAKETVASTVELNGDCRDDVTSLCQRNIPSKNKIESVDSVIRTEIISNSFCPTSQITNTLVLGSDTAIPTHPLEVKGEVLPESPSRSSCIGTIGNGKAQSIGDSVQEANDPGQQPPKSSSDIETIISALEEELKKNGSDVHSISITQTNDCTLNIQTSTQELGVEVIPHHQDIVSVENVEDVIWNVERSNEVYESKQAFILSSQDGIVIDNANSAMVNQSIDAHCDVVECEVLSENGKMRRGAGGRKRKRDKHLHHERSNDDIDRTCPKCHKVLTYPSSMAAHMRIHTGDRPFSCSQCERTFTTKANRDRHEATHVGLKPFKCSECEKSYTEKRSLMIHMRSHTGEKPYVCTVCGRGFAQKCMLIVHMDRHTDRKPHLCDLCGKSFRQKCQLDVHVKRHNQQANFPCPECSVRCYTKGDLVRHMIKHTGERPFQCSLCHRSFTRKQYLVDHENTHYGKKPYKCNVCPSTFHDMGSCHRHLRKHREEETSSKNKKESKPAAILSPQDYDTIVKTSQIGKMLTLVNGTQALVTDMKTEADGVTVYHVTCINGKNDTTELIMNTAEELTHAKENDKSDHSTNHVWTDNNERGDAAATVNDNDLNYGVKDKDKNSLPDNPNEGLADNLTWNL